MYYVIGIDGGGTKTEAVATDSNGKVIDRAEGGASNPHAITFERSMQNLSVLLDSLLRRGALREAHCRAICLGLAGVDREEEKLRVAEFLAGYASRHGMTPFEVYVRNDAEIALMAGLGNTQGMIVISGTGSIVFGLTPEGLRYRAGGWGHILGDQGSGYDIGLHSLQAVMKSFDGVLRETRLTPMFIQKCKFNSIDELRSYIYQPSITKQHIAEFAELCIQAGEQGDDIAAGIIHDAAKQLAALTAALQARDKFFASSPTAICGSVFKHSLLFRKTFEHHLRERCGHVDIRLSEKTPACGAAMLAVQLLRETAP